ncbi:hypothetical protein [Amniculibacterium aquaticum]|uniref:hypothetical protein n=1 Tax=Amniculibacterium aquaticum TaxID=2479858 RepID=UPI000F591389|nr:hypothetical protein [Amniculibacterium aquaticum]
MDLSQVKLHLNTYLEHQQVLDAAYFIVSSFGLANDNWGRFDFRKDENKELIVLTTDGEVGAPQVIMIPKNLFDFDFNLVINLIAHEMVHIHQKTIAPYVEDKNEREFQAHYEMLFHKRYPNIPDMSNFHKVWFGKRALDYYKRMGEESDLQQKYAEQKLEIDLLINSIAQP